jgi:hypothetical protein
LEYYTWAELQAGTTQHFEELQDVEFNALAAQLCDIHTIIEFALRAQVLPGYIKNHVTGGQQTVH